MGRERNNIVALFRTITESKGKSDCSDVLEATILFETYPDMEEAILYLSIKYGIDNATDDEAVYYLEELYKSFRAMTKDELFDFKKTMINEVLK